MEVGYTVAAGLWGRGFATEIGEWLASYAAQGSASELVAYTLPENASSRRVMEKLGFTFEREIVWAGRKHVLYRRRAVPG